VEGWFPWSKPAEPTTKALIVAVWSVDTQRTQNLNLLQRVTDLEGSVRRAYKLATDRCGARGLSLGDKPFALFVAPEYLMARSVAGGTHDPGTRRHIDESLKDILLQRYVALSDSCKGMLIVPGTIAWRKPLDRSVAKQTSSKTGLAKPVSRYDKAISSVQFYQQRQQLGLNRPLSGPLRTGITAPTTQQKLDALNQAKAWAPINSVFGYTPNELEFMARNTAYVLQDGRVLLKYNKQGDFHEILDGTKTVHIPGRLDGRFHVRPTSPHQRQIRFGLEVCLDHVFQTTGKEIPHLGEVDVHIITSAQVRERSENVAVANGGYLVHACSNRAYSGVKGRGFFGGLSDVRPLADELYANSPLQLWEIELDLKLAGPTIEPSTEPRREYY
jgi:hypothetical protein